MELANLYVSDSSSSTGSRGHVSGLQRYEIMITFPASPALSACDSLADIDDLDAFLAAQGDLSRWPTPPPYKDVIVVEEVEIDEDEEQDSILDCKWFCGKMENATNGYRFSDRRNFRTPGQY